MANLPAISQPEVPAKLSKPQIVALDLLIDGASLNATATKMAKKYGYSRTSWRRVLIRWCTEDETFQRALYSAGHAELGTAVPRITKAVSNRAARGNPNMARLALEASGFHNPRVDHKHSGDIKVTISGLPRPQAGPDETPPVDAEVVEE